MYLLFDYYVTEKLKVRAVLSWDMILFSLFISIFNLFIEIFIMYVLSYVYKNFLSLCMYNKHW